MAKDVRAGKAYVELGLKSKVDAGLQNVAKRLRTFGVTAMAIGGGITAAAGAAFGAVMYAGKSFADTGDAIGKMAARTGIGVEALQELSFAAGQSGTDIETVEAATRKMSKVVTDSLNGLKGPAESLRSIGIDPQQLAGLSVEDQFQTIAEALGAVDDATRKAALAQDIFGKSGTKLIPMLNGGSSGMAALRKEARNLGLVLNATDVSNAEALTDSFARSTRAIAALFTKLGAVAATPLIAISDGIAKMVSTVHGSIDEVRGVIESIIDVDRLRALISSFGNVVSQTMGFVKTFVLENQSLVFTLAKVAAVVVAAGAAIGTIGTVALAAGVLVPLLSTGLGILAGVAVKVALPLIGIGAAIAAVGALAWANRERVTAWAMAFWEAITPIRDAVGSILSIISDTFGGILNMITAGDYSGAVTVLWTGIKAAFFTGAALAIDAFYWLIDAGKTVLRSITSFIAGWATSLFAPVMPAIAMIGDLLGSVFGEGFGIIRDGLASLFENVTAVFGGMGSALLDGNFALAGEIAWAAIKHAFASGAAFVQEVWTGMIIILTETWSNVTTGLSEMITKVLTTIGGVIPGFSFIGDALRSVFGDALTFVSGLIGSFFDATVSTFGALGNAIASGNLSLAFSILWATAKLAFVSGIGTIQMLWSGFTIGLTEVWQTFAHTIVSVFRSMMGMIQSALSSSASAMASVFEKMASFDPTGVVGKLAGQLREDAKSYNALSQQLVEGQNAADKKRLAQQIANGQASLDEEKRITSQIAESRAARDKLIAEAAAGNKPGGELKAKEKRDELIRQANAAVPGGISAKASEEVAKLKIEIERAASAAADVAGGSTDRDKSDQNETTSSKKANIGSFSAVGAALAGMGGGNVQDKIAKNTEETRKNTGKMVQGVADVAANLKNIPQPKFA